VSMNKPNIGQMQRAAATSPRLAPIVIPPIATLAVEILFGWLFLISGFVGLITTFWMRHAPGFRLSLVSEILGIAVGLVLLLRPLSGVLSLTLVHRVFHDRRRCLDHVHARAQARAVGTMGHSTTHILNEI
jgi:Short repeat of unknown function (DUF308)